MKEVHHYRSISKLLGDAITVRADHTIVRVHLKAAIHVSYRDMDTLDRMTLEAMGRVIFPIPEDQHDLNGK